jgi:hypothetical protein
VGARMQFTRIEEDLVFRRRTRIQILAGSAHLNAVAATGVFDDLFRKSPHTGRSAQLFAVAVDHPTSPLDQSSPSVLTQAYSCSQTHFPLDNAPD